MKRSEIAALLTIIASHDRNGWIPEPDDVDLWMEFAIEGEWPSFAAVKRAFVVHRTEHPDFPMRPGHISQVLQRVRDQARAAYQVPKLDDFPKEALDDALEYQRFLNRCVSDHHRRWMEAFERGERPERPVSKLEQMAAKRAIESGDGDTPIRSVS